MSSNGWEYVGKKKGGKHQKNKQSEPKESKENQGQIKLSESTFQALTDFENRKQIKQNANNKPNLDNNHEELNEKKTQKNKPKKKTVSPTESPKASSNKPQSFEQIARQLKVADFEQVSENTKIKFPDMPLIWLKDIAYYLNDKLPSNVPEDVTFSDKPFDYPSSALPSGVLEFINRNIKQTPQAIVQLIQEQLLQNLVKSSEKSMGFRIMLQCISSLYPDFTLKNIQKFIQQRNSYSNRQQICLTILWVASKSGKKDLKTGLNVWLELMFPLIGQKAYTKFVIDSLRTLLELHSNTKQNANLLDVNQFFVLYDFINSPANGLLFASQKQLDSLYPKFRSLTLGYNPQQNSRLYFPKFFERLDSDLFSHKKSELLSELTYCLSTDNQCFSVWRSLYSNNLTQSSQLLSHIVNNYNSLPSTLSKKLLRETVLSFRNTNEDFRSQERTVKDGQDLCEKHCEELLQTMSSWKLPIKSLLLGTTVLLAVLLAYDTKSHGSFQKSYTGNLLKKTGTLPVVEQAFTKIETYSMISYSWLATNVPIYWNAVSAVLSPYVNLFWLKFTEVMIYMWDALQPVRDWINKNIPPLLEKISDEYAPKVVAVMAQIGSQLHTYYNLVMAFIINNALVFSNWMQTNVLTGTLAPENIVKVLSQSVEVLQSYVADAYQWTSTQFKALTQQ